jgi:DNA-binding IclR family transcriptional regulator
MPINIDRFDEEPTEALNLQQGTQPYQILQFLAEHDDKAFTQTEIHEATDINRGSVGAVLSRLEDRGLVRHRGRYWAIGEDDRLASYAAQTQASSVSTNDDYYGEE